MKKYRCIDCGERYTLKELEKNDFVCPECCGDGFEEIEEEEIIVDDYADIPYEERGLKK